jgi:hypothetical protein
MNTLIVFEREDRREYYGGGEGGNANDETYSEETSEGVAVRAATLMRVKVRKRTLSSRGGGDESTDVGSMARIRGFEYVPSFQLLMHERNLSLSTSVAHLKRFTSTI